MFKNENGKQKGATLLELVMAIGIVAVIAVSALSYLNSTELVRKTTYFVEHLAMMTTGINNLYKQQNNYTSIDADSIRFSYGIPTELDKGAPNALGHPWADDGITVTDFAFISVGDAYEISIAGIPFSACGGLGSLIYQDYEQVEVNGSLIADTSDLTAQCAPGPNDFTVRHR